jgi:hypothetical protein
MSHFLNNETLCESSPFILLFCQKLIFHARALQPLHGRACRFDRREGNPFLPACFGALPRFDPHDKGDKRK